MRAILTILMLLLCCAAATAGGRVALVYAGPGVCEGCAEAVAEAARLAGLEARLVGPAAIRAADPSRADLILIGGGEDSLEIAQGLGADGMAALRRFVKTGGAYVGICAGAYLAGATLDDSGRVAGLRLFDGDAYGATPYESRLEQIIWRGEARLMFTQEGPGFALGPGFDGAVFASYADGAPAALIARFGAGVVALSGPHPEADESWAVEAGLARGHLPGPALAAAFIRDALARR